MSETIGKFNFPNAFGATKIYVCHSLPTYRHEQFRFPKSRKRRIRKKWSKKAENFRAKVATDIFRVGDAFFVSPAIYQQMQEEYGINEGQQDGLTATILAVATEG